MIDLVQINKVVFWISFIMVCYAYFGYPLLLMLFSFFSSRKNERHEITPEVSFIITAYNEEQKIRDKLDNTLQLNYPSDHLEIIVASDCSSDRTDEIVSSYVARGVKLVRSPVRGGKEHAQQLAVQEARGDILVFSDVGTILELDAVNNIVANFSAPTIGCVSSVDKFINPDGTISGEGAYVKYEMFLRSLEAKVNTLVGLSGSFFAARKEVCSNWAPDLQSDFNTVLNSVKMGLRGISDPETVGYYKNIADEKKEFHRKVRTVLRGISVLMHNLGLLNPFKYGMFSWQLFSHKLCRWMVPFFLFFLFISSAVLAFSSGFYLCLLLLQMSFYLVAMFYHLSHHSDDIVSNNSTTPSTTRPGIIQNLKSRIQNYSKFPYYFVTVNASILVAWYKYIKGERATFWEPSKRL